MSIDKEPRRILLTRLRFLGDVILCSALAGALKERFPGAHIDFLCEQPWGDVLGSVPEISKVLQLPPGGRHGKGDRKAQWQLISQIRGEYDVVIDLFANPRSAMIARASGAPLRIGRARFPRSLAYNYRPADSPVPENALQHHFRFIESLTGGVQPRLPKLQVDETSRAEGLRFLEDRGLSDRTVAILTGATHQAKEWPADYFARLAAIIRMGGRYQPVFLSQPDKRERLEKIRKLSHSRVVILPELPLSSLTGVLGACSALVCNDGGIMHLAIALGLPTLALFGPTDPSVWFPYHEAPHAEVLLKEAHCRPCHLHECQQRFCLDDIEPEIVANRLAVLLESSSSR